MAISPSIYDPTGPQEESLTSKLSAIYDEYQSNYLKLQSILKSSNSFNLTITNCLAQEIYLAFRSEAGRGASMERLDLINRVAKSAAQSFITKLVEKAK